MTNSAVLHTITDAFLNIGYKRSQIKSNYPFADLFSAGTPVRTIKHAVFGQEPFDYRSACFGIQFARPNVPNQLLINELKALGAPQILIVNNGATERWAVTGKTTLLQETYKTNQLGNVIAQNASHWNPQSMIRAKSGFPALGPTQLDFVDIGLLPALEHEAGNKLDQLLGHLLHNIEQAFTKQRISLDAVAVFKIVFSLLAAKLLQDRNVTTSSGIDFSQPQTALQAVSTHYGASVEELTSNIPSSILLSISQEIGHSFSFNNISVDTLTYIYENTFVSRESRKSFGIHSTPSYIADYVLSQIPIETIPQNQWHATDPMAGHGIFLIAAMRRMRDLLPSTWTGRQRHNFFVKHLHGLEIEPFSVEVARMCLMLADFPELNGWDLVETDSFTGNTLETVLGTTTILIGNPPFEDIANSAPAVPKPAELLRRALPALPVDAYVGLVLPRSFTDGNAYARQRNELLKSCELISLTTLPDRIFMHSDSETVICVAQKRAPRSSVSVAYREVRDSDRETFRASRHVTWEDKVPQSYFSQSVKKHLYVPFLRDIWERLTSNPTIDSVATIKKGVEYQLNIDLSKVIRPKPFEHARRGVARMSPGFHQFQISDPIYLSTDQKYRRSQESESWNLPWDQPKIILPAARKSRGPWRHAAALDTEGLMANRLFYAVWPKIDKIDLLVLTAIFNSPLAAAYVYSHSAQRTVTKKVYQNIPIPVLSEKSSQFIHFLVHKYLDAVAINAEKAKTYLLQIDAAILREYSLPPKLERQLLDIFWDAERPVPFSFTGYIPPENTSWIPLHIYISEQFNESTPDIIMNRAPIVDDKEFISYLKNLGREDR